MNTTHARVFDIFNSCCDRKGQFISNRSNILDFYIKKVKVDIAKEIDERSKRHLNEFLAIAKREIFRSYAKITLFRAYSYCRSIKLTVNANRILNSTDKNNKAPGKRLKPTMLCHNGKVSLAGFFWAILSTVSISLVVIMLLPSDMSISYRLALCVGVPIVLQGITMVIACYIGNDEEFAVSGAIIELSAYKNEYLSNSFRIVSLYSRY